MKAVKVVVGTFTCMLYSSRVCNAQDESEEARELQRNGVTEGGKIKAGWEMRRVASGDRSEL